MASGEPVTKEELEQLSLRMQVEVAATLKAELTGLELRLVDRLAVSLSHKADTAIVEEHDKRISALEISKAERERLAGDVFDLLKRVAAIEKFRYAVPSVAFLTLIMSLVMVVYYWSHH